MNNPIDKLSDKLTSWLESEGIDKIKANALADTLIYSSTIIILLFLLYGIFILN